LRLYPGFRVPDESAATLGTRGLKEMKRNQCYELQKALRSGTKVDTQTKYFVLLPGIKAHEAFHPTSGAACFAQKIHPKLVEKVHELVAEGITDVREIKRALKQYVNRILYPDSTNRPDETNRAYFPTMKDIKNHVYSAKKALELSKFDQHNLKLKINQWEKEKPTSKFHFRPFEEKENSSSPGEEEQQIGSQGLLYEHLDSTYCCILKCSVTSLWSANCVCKL